MDIPRIIQDTIERQLGKQKVIMLYGTRRTGKTTIIEKIAAAHPNDVMILSGEDISVAEILQNRTVANVARLADGAGFLGGAINDLLNGNSLKHALKYGLGTGIGLTMIVVTTFLL